MVPLDTESSYPTLVTRSTSGLTSGRWYGFEDAIEAEVDCTGGNSGSNPTGISVHATRTSGALYIAGRVEYRLIAT